MTATLGSGRGAFDNTKIGFCYLGSMLVKFLSMQHAFKQMKEVHQLESNSVQTPHDLKSYMQSEVMYDEIAKPPSQPS